jgi:hypothetical protein
MLNYNGLEYLRETIPPILKLDYPHYEFVIVDNGSTDGSIEFIKKFKKIKIIENGENLGYSKGKNIGVKHAKGDYVLLLDEDILVTSESILSELYKIIKDKKDIFNISLLLTDRDEIKTEYYGGFYSLYGILNREKIPTINILNDNRLLIKIASPDGGALFFKREIYLQVGGYDESQPYFCDVGDYGIRGTIITGKINYLYTKINLIHLGNKRKSDNKIWCWKYRYVLPGLTKIIIKNYRVKNLLLIYPATFTFMILKTLKQFIYRRDLNVPYSFILSVVNSFLLIPEALKQRKIIQSKRVIKEDIFLKIKPQKI